MATFYTGVDQQRYDAGEKFLPQNRFLLNYTATTPSVEEDQVTTSYGIPNTNAFINSNAGGGGGGGINELDLTYMPGAKAQVPATWQGDYDIEGNKINELGRTGILGAWDKTKDFFSNLGTPKVKGTLGDRLSNQPRLPLPAVMATWSLSPFNRESRNWNPEMASQLNFLEGLSGPDKMMIGRDPQSGHLKYGTDSVLAGKNVISGFGSNDYEVALNKYIDKMMERGIIDEEFNEENLSKFQREKLERARRELAAWKNQQQTEDAGKGITHTDQGEISQILTGGDKTPGPGKGKTDAWQETFSGTQDGGGEFDTTSSSPGTSEGWSDADWGPDTGEFNQGGRVYLNLGGLASIL